MTETAAAPASIPVSQIDPATQQPIAPTTPVQAVVQQPAVDPGQIPGPAAAPVGTNDPWAGLDDPDLKTFVGTKTPAEIAKELKAAQSLIGKKTVGVPGEGSTPEEQAAFHTARGVPATSAEYKFDDVLAELTKDLPADLVVMDPAREAETRELLKAANISNGEARELIRRQLGKEIETRKAEVAAAAGLQSKTQDLITQGWGPKKDEYTQDANNYMRSIGIDDDVLSVMNAALGTKPEARFKFLEMARTQGALLREGGQPVGAAHGMNITAMTPEQARTAKEAYLNEGNNRDVYLGNRDAPRYKEVQDRMTAFIKAERGLK